MRSAILLLVCVASANAFFLNPSSFNNPNTLASKKVCPDRSTLASQRNGFTGLQKPWFECSNQGKLFIQSCSIDISTPQDCPTVHNTQFPVSSVPNQCEVEHILNNNNCTALLQQNCDGLNACNFDWFILPRVTCMQLSNNGISGVVNPADTAIFPANTANSLENPLFLNVRYVCNDKRGQCK